MERILRTLPKIQEPEEEKPEKEPEVSQGKHI